MSTAAVDPAGDTAAAVTPAPQDRRRQFVERLGGDFRMVPVALSLACIWLYFSATTEGFLSARNMSNLSLQICVTGVLALGLVLVLLIAEIDLSVAALSGVCAAITAGLAVNQDWSPIVAMLVGIGAGAGMGLINGIIVVFGAPSFVVTLGASLALGGILLLLLPDAGQINVANTLIADIANTYMSDSVGWLLVLVVVAGFAGLRYSVHRHKGQRGLHTSAVRDVLVPSAAVGVGAAIVVNVLNQARGVPIAVAIFIGLSIVLWYASTQTRFGTYLYAIGGNAEAARRAGIPVNRLRIATFVLAGSFAAIAGIIAASRVLGVSNQSGASTLLLQAIAAAVIGGASLFGGHGSVWAALMGALVIGSVSNGLDLKGSTEEVKLIVQGAILVLAVMVDAIVSRGSLLPKPK
jgi:D-xylose transport system permease protein